MTKNIIANFIGRFWSILSNFLFIPLYIHYLGFECYSIISFTLVIAGLMATLDAGLTATLSREFSRVDNTHAEKIRIFKTLETAYFIVVGLCISLVFLFSGIIAENWLNTKSFNATQVAYFLKIMSFDTGFQLLLRYYMGGLIGLNKHVKANMYQVGWGVFRNGLVIGIVLFVPTLEAFFIWQTTTTILFAVLLKLSLNKALTGRYQFDFKPKIETAVFKRISKFAGGMLLIHLVAGLNTQMDKIAISKLLAVENLGYYTLAVSLAMGIIVVVNPISIALLPQFTALYSAGKREEAAKLFNKVNLLVAVLVFSIMANMAFFSESLIWIWTGDLTLAQNTGIYLPIIAFSAAMLAMTMIPYNVAIANGYTKLNNQLGLISLFVTLPGYWFATKQFGTIGAAYVFCGVQSIMTLIYFYFVNKKFIKAKSSNSFYIQQLLFPMLISLSVAFLLSIIPFGFKDNRIALFMWIGFATLITIAVLAILLVPRAEFKAIGIKINALKNNYKKIK